MNFSFLSECETKTPELQNLYQAMIIELGNAEHIYWSNPQKCGIVLRGVAEKICRVYNIYYEIGCPNSYTLEEFLCYTEEDAHNALVSRFLSGVRKEQRDRLNKLRVLGDDCIWGDEAPDQGMSLQDRMEKNARRMMETMMETLKEMCIKMHNRTELVDISFMESELPQKKPEMIEPDLERKKEDSSYKNLKEKIKKIFMAFD